MRSAWMLLVLMSGCAVMPALAQVNKWVDDKGRVQYGDQPPANKAQAQKPPATPAKPRQAPPGKPLPEQPKNYVPGDPLIERLKANEERQQRENVRAKCWKISADDCADPETIRQMMEQEKKAAAKAQKPNLREPLSPDFCKRNPKVEGCLPKK